MASSDPVTLEDLLRGPTDLAVMELDADGRILSWQGAAAGVFGYAAEEILGQLADVLFLPEDRARGFPAYEREVARETGRAPDDRWHLRKDGTRFWASGIVLRVGSAEAPTGYLKALRDRTDLRMRIEALQQRTADLQAELDRRDAQTRVLLHELRNPVSPLLSAARLLQQPLDDAGRKQVVDIAVRQTELLKRLLDEATTTSDVQPRTLQRRPVLLHLALRAAVAALRDEATQKSIALQLVLPPVRVVLNADPERLQQLFLNLIGNAIKYTPAGGHVSITVNINGGEAMISVEDDGLGIAPENAARIFELFTREEPELAPAAGHGIGLAVVKQVASLHGGSIVARSAGHGHGSQFILTLPIAADLPPDAAGGQATGGSL